MNRTAATTRRLTTIILATLILLTLTVSFVRAGGASPGTARWVLQHSPTTASLADISCPSVSECVAVGANATIIRTVNGGRTWIHLTSPYGTAHPTASFASVRCPTPGVCSVLAVPNVVLRTTNGGRSWQAHIITLPSTLSQLGRLACPTRSVCYATATPSGNTFTWFTHSAAIYQTTDGNATWHQVSIPPRVPCPGDCGQATVGYDLQWISCQSGQHCYAGGITFIGSHEGYASALIRTTNGTTWGTVPHPYLAPNIGTCPTKLICVGVYYEPTTPTYGPDLHRTTNGSVTWSTQPMPIVLTSIACSGTSFCALAGPHGKVATLNGMTLLLEGSPTTRTLTAVACPRAGLCYAVGNAGMVVARKT